MESKGLSSPPGTVTPEYTVKFLRPSPIDRQWHLGAGARAINEHRVDVSRGPKVDGVVTATNVPVKVAVKESIPPSVGGTRQVK
jgi:hypothetical protein